MASLGAVYGISLIAGSLASIGSAYLGTKIHPIEGGFEEPQPIIEEQAPVVSELPQSGGTTHGKDRAIPFNYEDNAANRKKVIDTIKQKQDTLWPHIALSENATTLAMAGIPVTPKIPVGDPQYYKNLSVITDNNCSGFYIGSRRGDQGIIWTAGHCIKCFEANSTDPKSVGFYDGTMGFVKRIVELGFDADHPYKDASILQVSEKDNKHLKNIQNIYILTNPEALPNAITLTIFGASSSPLWTTTATVRVRGIESAGTKDPLQDALEAAGLPFEMMPDFRKHVLEICSTPPLQPGDSGGPVGIAKDGKFILVGSVSVGRNRQCDTIVTVAPYLSTLVNEFRIKVNLAQYNPDGTFTYGVGLPVPTVVASPGPLPTIVPPNTQFNFSPVPPGASGATGPTTLPGASGPTGPTTLPGASGPTGPTTSPDASGPTGPTTLPGASGPTGPTTLPGASGPTGPTTLPLVIPTIDDPVAYYEYTDEHHLLVLNWVRTMRDPHNITREQIKDILSSELITFPQFEHALADIKRETYNNIRIPDLFSYGKKLEIDFIPEDMLFSPEIHNWITLFTKIVKTKKITWDRYYSKTITFDDLINFFTAVKTEPIKQYHLCKYTLQLLFDPDYKKSLTEKGVEYIEKIGHIIAVIKKKPGASPNKLTQQDIAEIIADSDSSIPEIVEVLYYVITKDLKIDGKFVRIIDFNAVKYLLDGSPQSGGATQSDLDKLKAKLVVLQAQIPSKTGAELDNLNKKIGFLQRNIANITKKLSIGSVSQPSVAATPAAAAASLSGDERFKLHLVALKWLLKLKLPELTAKDIASAPPNVIVNGALNPTLNMKILTLFTGQFVLPRSGSLVGQLRGQRPGPVGLNALEQIQADIAERQQEESAFETGVKGYKKGLSQDAAKKFLEEADRGKLEAIIKKDKEIRELKDQIKTIKESTTVKSKLEDNLTKQLNAAVLAQNTAEVRDLLKQINPKLDDYIKKAEENKQNKGNEPQKPKEVDQNDWNALRNKAKAIKMSDPDLDTKINKLKDEYHTRYPAIGYKTVRNLVEFMGKQNNNQQKKKGGDYSHTLRNHFRNNRATLRRY